MTSLNSRTPLPQDDRWAERARNIGPSEALVEATVVAMHDAQAQYGAQGARRRARIGKRAAFALGSDAGDAGRHAAFVPGSCASDAGKQATFVPGSGTHGAGKRAAFVPGNGAGDAGKGGWGRPSALPRSRGAAHAGTGAQAPALTRRRFVALGGVCAAVAAVAVGVPLAWRGNENAGAPLSGSPTFGLAIAQATEPGKSVVLQASDASLMPLTGASGFRALELALNLSCVGDNIDTLTFSLLNVPTETVYGTHPFEPSERTCDLVGFYKEIDQSLPVEQRDAWSASLGEDDTGTTSTLAVDLTAEPGWNGSRQTDYGTEYDVLSAAVGEDDFWSQDPVMAAKHDWLNTRGSENSTSDEEQELLDTYTEAYAQVSATQEDAIAWSRTCWISSAVLAAANLKQTTLQVEAGFADGTTLAKRYRIGTVDNFEDVMGARFDALYDLRSEETVDLSYRLAPFYYFLNEYHDASEDARLSAPAFTITDVTDIEDAADGK